MSRTEGVRALTHSWWEWKAGRLLQKSLAVLETVKLRVSTRPSTSTTTSVHTKTCPCAFVATLSATDKTWKRPSIHSR